MRSPLRVAIALSIVGLVALLVNLGLGATAGGVALPLLPAAAAWTMVLMLRHPMVRRGSDVQESGSRSRPRQWLGALVLLSVCSYLTVAFVIDMSGSASPWRIPARLAAWSFALKTAPLATDECLVYRVAHYGGAFSTSDKTSGGTLGESSGGYWEEAPGRSANGELFERGRSALPAIKHELLAAVASGDRESQGHLVGVLEQIARWPEADDVVRAWANAAPAPVAQRDVKKWLTCIEKGRREYIGKATDRNCHPLAPKPSGEAR